MMKLSLAWLLLLVSCLATAQPDQIDVLGIIPDKSTVDDVRGRSSGALEGGLFFLEIGGYKLPCIPEFSQSKLSTLVCATGKKFANASNFDIHNELTKGFTQKFGPATSTFVDPVRTPLGVEYKSEEIWWIDKTGNALVLYSMRGKIDQGGLLLMSAEQTKRAKEDAIRKDSQRRF